MAKSPRNSKKQAGRPKSRPGCSACKQRRLKCDETLPICRRCESSGRICKGLWGKTLTAPQTLAPSTSPAAITATPEYGRTSAEAGASTAIKTSGLGGVHTEDCIVVEAFEGQKEKNTQDQKPKVRANDQGGDYRPSTLMVVINHSELSANTPEQTVSEDELAEEANISCHVSAVANRQDFQNTLTGKRAADTVPLSDAKTTPSTKRARRDKQEGGDLTIVSTGTIGEHIQTTKEDKRLKSASASDTSEAPSRPERIVSRTSRQIPSDDYDAVQTAKLALLAVDAKPPYIAGRSKPSQDKMPSDSRIELNCASPYSHSTSGESQQTQTREGSACTDQQPSATGDFNKSHGDKSPSQSNNHPNDFQPPPSDSLPQNSQEPSNSNIPTHDRQSFDLLIPSELDQDPRRLRNSRTADGPSQNTLTSERVRHPLEPQTLGTSSTARNNQSPIVGSSFQSVTQNLDLSRTSPHTPNQTSMQDKHAGSQPFQLQRVSHLSNHLNAEHYPESQRNELGPGDASGALRDQGDSSVNHNQQHLSTKSTNPGNSAPQRERPDHRLRPITQNSYASSSGHSLQTQSTCQPPAVTFTMDNRIQTALPMATVDLLIETLSRNCKVVLRSKTTPTEDTVYPVHVIMWQHSSDFYKWYMTEARATKVSGLMFQLFNVNWKLENALSIPTDNPDYPDYFRMLKQCIWDSFWVALELNHASAPFKILVKLAPHRDNLALPRGQAATKQTSMNATTSALPAVRFTTSGLENVGVVAHSRSPAVMIPQMYDRRPHDIEVTTRQSAFAVPPPRPNNNATAPQIQFPPVQTTQLPEHCESSMESSSQVHGSGTSMGVAAYVPRQHQPGDAPRGMSSRQTPIAALLAPEIAVRLQTDGAGRVSGRYSKWVLRPEITTTDFFAWFASQTGRGGGEGPPSLRFTFKDAMPAPTSSTIAQANEDHFNLMKKDLKTQLERAKEFVPNLKEFLILVTDPGWISEEEDW